MPLFVLFAVLQPAFAESKECAVLQDELNAKLAQIEKFHEQHKAQSTKPGGFGSGAACVNDRANGLKIQSDIENAYKSLRDYETQKAKYESGFLSSSPSYRDEISVIFSDNYMNWLRDPERELYQLDTNCLDRSKTVFCNGGATGRYTNKAVHEQGISFDRKAIIEDLIYRYTTDRESLTNREKEVVMNYLSILKREEKVNRVDHVMDYVLLGYDISDPKVCKMLVDHRRMPKGPQGIKKDYTIESFLIGGKAAGGVFLFGKYITKRLASRAGVGVVEGAATKVAKQTGDDLATSAVAKVENLVDGKVVREDIKIVTLSNGSKGVFKTGDTYKYDVAVSRFDRDLGTNVSAVTTEREVGGVTGSLQEYVDGTSMRKALGVKKMESWKHHGDQKLIVLDYVTGQNDRHLGNVMVKSSGEVRAFDSSSAFRPQYKTIQEYKNIHVNPEAISDDMFKVDKTMADNLKRLRQNLQNPSSAAYKEYSEYLSAEEINGCISRIDDLLKFNSVK